MNRNKFPSRSETERFREKVAVGAPDECWLWIASLDEFGYGRFVLASLKEVRAHRWAYEQANGPIPPGANVLHKCPGGGNQACVNPAHLKIGSQQENIEDMDRAGKRGAIQGEAHPSSR